MKTFRPIVHKDAYTLAVEKIIRAYFAETIFDPLFGILESARVPDVRENAPSSALKAALETGRVWYADGAFTGQFTAPVARELRDLGATFEDGQFKLPASSLPFDLRGAAEESLHRARTVHERVGAFLDASLEHVSLASTGIEIDQTLSVIRGDLYRQLENTVPQTAVEFVAVGPEMSPGIENILVEEFREDVDRSIKTFLPTELRELRAEVQANAFAGYRSDKLTALIEQRYGVSKRKAAFLADQETGLFVSKFREARYRDIGIRSYKWSTSHDDRVRPDHQLLNGEVFSWESPPVTNRKTSARNHPGEDYRCRCVPIPILDMDHFAARINAKSELHCAKPSRSLIDSY